MKNMINFNKKNSYIFGLFFSIWMVSYLINELPFNKSIILYQIIFVLCFLSILYLIIYSIKFRDSSFFIIFGFIALYSYPYYMAIFRNVYVSYLHRVNNYYTLTKTFLLYILFILPFILFLDPKNKITFDIKRRNNDFLFICFLFVFFICWKYGLRGESIIESGGYGKGESSKSSIYEYALIIIFFLYLYIGQSKIKLAVFFLCCILYIFKDILYGGRIESLMLLLMLFFLFFQKKIRFSRLITLGVILLYIFKLYENIRGNIVGIVTDGDYIKYLNPFRTNEIEFLTSNEGDVFWAGERMLYLKQDGFFTPLVRFKAACSFILSIFVPYRILGPLSNLTQYKTNVYVTVGGGLASSYFYIMFTIFGVFFIGYILAKIFSNFQRSKRYTKVYILFVFITLPRWYAYYPIQLIKLCLISVLLFKFQEMIHCFTVKYFK